MNLYQNELTPTQFDCQSQYEILKRLDYYAQDKFSNGQRKSWIRNYIEKYNLEIDINQIDIKYIQRPMDGFCRLDMLGCLFTDTQHGIIRRMIFDRHRISIENQIAPTEEQLEIKKGKKEQSIKSTSENLFKIVDEVLEGKSKSLYERLKVSNLGPRYTKKIIEYLSGKENGKKLIKECEKWITESKKPRKERKEKAKDPSDLIKLFNYQKEFHGVKSLDPTKIIGSKVVVVYHSKKNLISFYYAVDKRGIGINRSTLINLNTETSKHFDCVDKKVLTKLSGSGIISINKIKNEMTSEILGDITGRINSYQVIVAIG